MGLLFQTQLNLKETQRVEGQGLSMLIEDAYRRQDQDYLPYLCLAVSLHHGRRRD